MFSVPRLTQGCLRCARLRGCGLERITDFVKKRGAAVQPLSSAKDRAAPVLNVVAETVKDEALLRVCVVQCFTLFKASFLVLSFL